MQQELIKPGLLNINTFKAIYNAVAKNLVADSEFFAESKSNYNIIYCKDLYSKPAVEMEEYLKLQSEILSPDARSYTARDVIKNKKIFLYIDTIDELNIKKRAEDIKNYNKDLPQILNAKLNSLKLTVRND